MSLSGKVAIVTGSRPGPRPGLRAGAGPPGRGRRRQRRRRRRRGRGGPRSIQPPAAGPPPSSRPVGPTETARQLVQAAVASSAGWTSWSPMPGMLRDKCLLKMTDEDFDPVINVHLRGTFTCVREAFGYFKEQRHRRPHHRHRLPDRPARQLRPDQLRRRQGRHRRHGAHLGAGDEARPASRANAVIPVAATAMTKTVPYFAAAVEADEARRADAGLLPPRPRLRHGGRRRRADRVPGLRRRRRHHRPGDRRRRRPPAAVVPPRGRGHRIPRRRLGLRGPRRRTSARCFGTSCSAWARTSRRCRRTCSPNRPEVR